MQSYKIHFLDDEEFERLPYKDVDSSLGLADSKSGQAYVRRTGMSALDVYTAAHELEHLRDGRQGVHADHEKYKDGVYYKPAMLLPLLLGGLSAGAQIYSSRQQASATRAAAASQQQQANVIQPSVMSPFKTQPNVVRPFTSPASATGGGTTSSPIDELKKKAFYSGRSPEGGF